MTIGIQFTVSYTIVRVAPTSILIHPTPRGNTQLLHYFSLSLVFPFVTTRYQHKALGFSLLLDRIVYIVFCFSSYSILSHCFYYYTSMAFSTSKSPLEKKVAKRIDTLTFPELEADGRNDLK
jgi:hypothetical protein